MNHMTLKQCLFLLLLVVGIVGCAGSGERPEPQLARAEASIEQAEQADARRFGVVELDQARDKYEQAQDEVEKGNMAKAKRLAHEAQLDAELAAAKARTTKTERAAEELERSIQILQSEIQRGQRK